MLLKPWLSIVLSLNLLSCGSKDDSGNDDDKETSDWWDVDTKGENDGKTDAGKAEDKNTKESASKDKKGDGKSPTPYHRFTGELDLANNSGTTRYYRVGETSCDIQFDVTLSMTITPLCEGCTSAHTMTYKEAKTTIVSDDCTEGTKLVGTEAIIGLVSSNNKEAKLRRFVDGVWLTEEQGYVAIKSGTVYIGWGEGISVSKK